MAQRRFPPRWFQKPTLQIARHLLGCLLCTKHEGIITSGKIVEVEAYHGARDQASHAFRGPSPRTAVMFQEPGLCYVYFIYGMYHCVNVVTEEAGIGAAVLIRALEPAQGIEVMKKRRKMKKESELTNGPGKLCQALAIDKLMLGEDFSSSSQIWLEPFQSYRPSHIGKSTRIGISKSKELEWRFFLKGNPWVSPHPNRAKVRKA